MIRGGGPAGAAAAILLAREGFDVLLLEQTRAPTDKVCGEFLSPEALPQLDRLGALAAARALGAVPIAGARVAGPTGRGARIDLVRPGLALSRRALDALLLETAVAAGATVWRGTRVLRFLALPTGGFAAIGPGSERVASGRIALDAAGKGGGQPAERRGRARRQPPRGGPSTPWSVLPAGPLGLIGVKAHFTGIRMADAVELQSIPGGYCGLCGVEGGLVNVCLVVDGRRLRDRRPEERTLAALCTGNRALAERLAAGRQVSPRVLATARLRYDACPPAVEPVPRVGDAAGLVAPLAGDGMAVALRAGELAARRAAEGLRGSGAWRAGYAADCRREFAAPRRWSLALHALLCRPAAASAALALLGQAPWLGTFLFARTRGGPP